MLISVLVNAVDGVVNFLESLTSFVLTLSYITGSVIVNLLLCFGQTSKNGMFTICSVIQILFEDFIIFICDIIEKMWYIGTVLFNANDDFYEVIASTIIRLTNIFDDWICCISNAYYILVSFIDRQILNLTQLLIWIKEFLILSGSGTWFAVTFIPISISELFVLCTSYIGLLIEDTRNVFSDLTCFFIKLSGQCFNNFFDVPYQAILGLLILGCIIYFLPRIVTIINSIFLHILRNLRKSVLTKRKVTPMEQSLLKMELSDDHISCIVCTERPKCIVMLPCKHLCLCVECHNELRYYNRLCPICRSHVDRTMKIFM